MCSIQNFCQKITKLIEYDCFCLEGSKKTFKFRFACLENFFLSEPNRKILW